MSKPSSSLETRTASAADAPALVAIFEQIASERVHSAIDRPWTLEQQRGYLESMSPREVIHVRASNPSAQAFYRGLGFVECGRRARQVVIDGQDDDEVLMECLL